MEISPVQEDVKEKLAEELSKIKMGEVQDLTSPAKVEVKKESLCHGTREGDASDLMHVIQVSTKISGVERSLKKEVNEISKKLDASSGASVVDIDLNIKDPQLCSLYAPRIYNNIRVKELDQRPSVDYMEKLQRDISPSMRGILIDWLVEVSEEYTLVPDTLYLTVNLIDRFLSQTYIEKQRLQLLGVTCMLIASKYEEIIPPRVEGFCFITDNTYTRGEVLKMESQVLNFLYFQLSVPTTKTFLRRFIHAAQASCKVPCVELEFLANYLAELTLVEYSFLKFLPSLIAASAVFLARWTLNQSDHPWNSTLEHYSRYTASELRTTVLALENLQLNTNGCCLNAIRDKYRQQKFKSVATLTSGQRVSSLF
ncbi:CYCLIN-A2-4 [Salix koriyanagi]|uniref:B-like cyclin n=1 Tax=Salix koriyanagi TaxID=2511006 RepID=A0A9Q0ZT32_9ROSI|nr:CYCLIN-A2-4 [Salix koriyanagi]